MICAKAAAALALTPPPQRLPRPELKQRADARDCSGAGLRQPDDRFEIELSGSWLPWSIAALLMVFCGFLVYYRAQLYRELNQARGRDPLNEMMFVVLAPQKDAPPEASAVVAWKPNDQSGMIRISGLPASRERIISFGPSMPTTRIRSMPELFTSTPRGSPRSGSSPQLQRGILRRSHSAWNVKAASPRRKARWCWSERRLGSNRQLLISSSVHPRFSTQPCRAYDGSRLSHCFRRIR